MRCVCCSSNMADADSRKNAKNLTGHHLCQVKSCSHQPTNPREAENFLQISWKTWKFHLYIKHMYYKWNWMVIHHFCFDLCMESRARNFTSPRHACHSVSCHHPCLYQRTVTHHHLFFLRCPMPCFSGFSSLAVSFQCPYQYNSWEGTVIHS